MCERQFCLVEMSLIYVKVAKYRYMNDIDWIPSLFFPKSIATFLYFDHNFYQKCGEIHRDIELKKAGMWRTSEYAWVYILSFRTKCAKMSLVLDKWVFLGSLCRQFTGRSRKFSLHILEEKWTFQQTLPWKLIVPDTYKHTNNALVCTLDRV